MSLSLSLSVCVRACGCVGRGPSAAVERHPPGPRPGQADAQEEEEEALDAATATKARCVLRVLSASVQTEASFVLHVYFVSSFRLLSGYIPWAEMPSERKGFHTTSQDFARTRTHARSRTRPPTLTTPYRMRAPIRKPRPHAFSSRLGAGPPPPSAHAMPQWLCNAGLALHNEMPAMRKGSHTPSLRRIRLTHSPTHPH